jgi:hypothetical protein
MANPRTIADFWLVWYQGMEWPALFASERAAKEQAAIFAKGDGLGYTVHLCRLDTVGTIMVPHNPSVSGRMADAVTAN